MNQPIPLHQPKQNDGSTVHNVALSLFSMARAIAGYVAEVPSLAEQAANDIIKAWEDSAKAQQRPKP